jgi:phage gp36-like protein
MYATVADMVARFGSDEMIRLSTPSGQDLVAVQSAPVLTALEEASSQIDSYLRRRYAVPLDIVPAEILRATCFLARYDLSMGEQKEPSEQMRLARKEIIEWLVKITEGKVVLDLQQVPAGDESFSMAQGRDPVFQSGGGAWP